MSLSDKLLKIQALIDRASSDGERQAALLAKDRVLSSQSQVSIEHHVSLEDIWQKRLFAAICNKYGLHTYRYQRQKFTTTMVRTSRSVMNELLWPEYLKHAEMLQELIEEVLDSMLAKIDEVEDEVIISGEIGMENNL